jgi:hypothetical protein
MITSKVVQATVRNVDLTDEWAQRFLRDVRDAIDAADHKSTVVEVVEVDSSWLHEVDES